MKGISKLEKFEIIPFAGLLPVFVSAFLCACSFEHVAKSSTDVAQINIQQNGMSIKTRPYMSEICKGFILSKQQVLDFIIHSTRIVENKIDPSYEILPCYSSGTVTIDRVSYSWTIHSGGIGMFSNKKEQFWKVCGKRCCESSPGIC